MKPEKPRESVLKATESNQAGKEANSFRAILRTTLDFSSLSRLDEGPSVLDSKASSELSTNGIELSLTISLQKDCKYT